MTAMSPLQMTMISGLNGFLTRRETNALVAADPTLALYDPHPGRLIRACNLGDISRLRALLEMGAPHAWPARRYRLHGALKHASTLWDAAYQSRNPAVVLLAVEYMSWTPRTAADVITNQLIYNSWTEVADALLARSTDRNAVLERLRRPTAASMCLRLCTDIMFRWFVGHGLNVNTVSEVDGRTPLFSAVHFANRRRIALLLSLGAQVDNECIMQCCRRYRHYRKEDPEGSGAGDMLEVFRMLIPHADMKAFSCYGLTPLMWLVSEVWGRTDLFRLMLRAGADVNQPDTEGRTALWWAQRMSPVACVEYVDALRAER